MAASWILASQACFAAEIISSDRWYGIPVWSPDGSNVAVAAYPTALERGKPIPFKGFSEKSKIYILNSSDNSVVHELENSSVFLEWSPDGKYLLCKTIGGGILFDTKSGQPVHDFEQKPVAGRTWAKDSKRILCSSFPGSTEVKVLFVQDGHKIQFENVPGLSSMFEHPTWSPDDKFVSSTRVNSDEFDGVYLSNRTPTYAHIWDASTGKLVKTWKHKGFIERADWTPDAKKVVLSEPGSLRFFSAQGFEEINSIKTKSRDGVPFTFTPDGTKLIYQDVDYVYVVDLSDFRQLQKIEGPTSGYLNVGCSPDGKFLLLGSGSAVAICDIATGRYICWAKMPHAFQFEWIKKPECIVGAGFHYAPYILPINSSVVKEGVNYFPSGGASGAPNWFSRIHPKSVEDTFAAFDKCLTAAQIEKYKNTPERDLGAYGGGSYITDSMMANAYCNWDLNDLKKWFDDRGAVDPRDVVDVMITSYWRHLNGKTLDIEKQVKARVEYWMSTKKEIENSKVMKKSKP